MNLRNAVAALWFSACLWTAVLAQDPPQRTRESVARDLEEIARTASVMVDGDVCLRIMTRRALESMFVVSPRDPWAAGDNFDVNEEPYIQTKKTLIRLSRLVSYPCDVNLWMPFREKPDMIQILIRNVNEWSQFWTWGVLVQNMPPEMKRVLDTGERVTVMQRLGMISVLAPVYDSPGERVALVEVVSLDPGATPPPVHAGLRVRGDDRGRLR
ncbi:MAG: hypothetical protein HXY20_14350 [Acidobacteria bacterium]|nr:hypothetical protein [Acidobacteriota bacterium]